MLPIKSKLFVTLGKDSNNSSSNNNTNNNKEWVIIAIVFIILFVIGLIGATWYVCVCKKKMNTSQNSPTVRYNTQEEQAALQPQTTF